MTRIPGFPLLADYANMYGVMRVWGESSASVGNPHKQECVLNCSGLTLILIILLVLGGPGL